MRSALDVSEAFLSRPGEEPKDRLAAGGATWDDRRSSAGRRDVMPMETTGGVGAEARVA